MLQGNVLAILFTLIVWAIIIYFILRIYKKENVIVPIWKILIAYYIGAFTLSLPLHLFGASVELAILPLGAWLSYAILNRRGSWQIYRKYVWLGFFSTYFYVVAFFIEHPLHMLLYKQDDLITYVSNVSEAQIYSVHPLGNQDAFLIDSAEDQLQNFTLNNLFNDEWYEEMYLNGNEQKRERFPYLLYDTKSKWGSGYKPTVYIEQDGKGILVTLQNDQYYFSSEQSILSEVATDE